MKNIPNKKYYSQRKTDSISKLDLESLKQILVDFYYELDSDDYFEEWLGFREEWGNREGGITKNPISYTRRKLRKNLWPIADNVSSYTEDDVMSMFEFLYDHVSIPSGDSWSRDYDQKNAQIKFRDEINPVLNDYGVGLTLSENGEILINQPEGFEHLITANIPKPKSVKKDTILAIKKLVDDFRRRGTNIDDRKNIIVNLSAIFEELKDNKLLSQVLNEKDENAIFEFANKFGIRHKNSQQIQNYDKDIWLSWAFYFYLATIHAVLRMIIRQENVSYAGDELWIQLLEEVRRKNNTLYGVLRMANYNFKENILTLEFRFLFHKKC